MPPHDWTKVPDIKDAPFQNIIFWDLHAYNIISSENIYHLMRD